ncbi:redoxin domain-containing protein [Hymenobacter sp. HMF4947]|uniref:thioredoxin-dependent peroxiredoxin n=1 Tax=Hymenobacter ginkgonis TaxID=2682976 RepID=A0A7K1TDR7_9BACT|nr:peroxiredoxin-like family protein [Hymenobacter ginkgonis]MVN76549.1 redoxin domain-containing protein [Hymenobacter ginkgonis]
MSVSTSVGVSSAFQQDLAATAQHLASVLPPEVARTIDSGIAAVEASGQAAQVRQAGQPAPDFTLPDATGQPVTLSALVAQGPVVLTFYRGNWCPYCNVQLRAYQQVLAEIALRGATLVAISPQTPELTTLTASEKQLAFPVLSDVGNAVARQYGLAYGVGAEVGSALRSVGIDLAAFNDNPDDELPLTATFIIGTDGLIAQTWVEANFKHRADPADIIRALEQLPTPQFA